MRESHAPLLNMPAPSTSQSSHYRSTSASTSTTHHAFPSTSSAAVDTGTGTGSDYVPDVPMYNARYQPKPAGGAGSRRGRTYVYELFPEELWATMGRRGARAGAAVTQRSAFSFEWPDSDAEALEGEAEDPAAAAAAERDPGDGVLGAGDRAAVEGGGAGGLEAEEEDEGARETDYEEDDADMAGDYNAEAYFENGDEEFEDADGEEEDAYV